MANEEPQGENSEDNSFNKPSYDGRLQYYKLAGSYMTSIAAASLNDNFILWLELINGLFDIFYPFIKPTDITEIEKQIEECDKNIDILAQSSNNKTNQLTLNKFLEKKLHVLTRKLYCSSKHMLLPIKSEENDNLNVEDFLEGSDL